MKDFIIYLKYQKGLITLSQSIDSLKMKPSVIKIHTEGEELNVLKGSIKTINLHNPLLMINIITILMV